MGSVFGVTLLPAQIQFLARLSADGYGGAIGISQDGSVIRVHTNTSTFAINAAGQPIDNPQQEKLDIC